MDLNVPFDEDIALGVGKEHRKDHILSTLSFFFWIQLLSPIPTTVFEHQGYAA